MKKLLLMTAFCVLFKVIKKVLVKVVSVLVFLYRCAACHYG